ncbi:MAG: tRNA (adenosine(37)-N6)-threonylcarbamoyltransferase complex dimerization subunit type 1 TsaB [Bacteroidia bacterium]
MERSKEIVSLNIETSGTLCSVSLGINDKCIDCMEADDGEYHSERLHVFVAELLRKNNIHIRQLSVISVSSGPGSYTGLRIGAAAAKSMAYALGIPMITLSSLHTQALNFIDSCRKYDYIASTMHARGNKIYLGIYSHEGSEILPPQTFVVSESSIQEIVTQYPNVVFIGSGSVHLNNVVKDNHVVKPSAKYMVKKVFEKYQQKAFADIVYFEPLYI